VSTTLLDVQQELNAVAADVGVEGSGALADLGSAIVSMRSSLDSGYQVRTRQSGDAELVATTDRAILAQRDQLVRAVEAFETAAG
jgi:hypothetical protein